MATRRSPKSPPLARQAAERAVAVPQVIAHRLARLARAGPAPSARDREEFRRMGAEKAAAFAESWNAMATGMLEANQDDGPPSCAGSGRARRPAIRPVRRPSGWPCGHGHRPSRPGAGASVRRGEREAPGPRETPVSGLTPRPGGRGAGRGNARPKTASDPASRRPGLITSAGLPTRAGCRAAPPARLYSMCASR